MALRLASQKAHTGSAAFFVNGLSSLGGLETAGPQVKISALLGQSV